MTQLTAKQARDNMLEAQGMNGTYLRAETDALLNEVADASKQGKSAINTSYIDPVIQNRLRTLGYTVVWTEGYDQRDPGYTTIGW
jgi:hypothetical protein